MRDSVLQMHLLQQLSTALVRGLDADRGATGLAIQPTGVVRTCRHPVTRAMGACDAGC